MTSLQYFIIRSQSIKLYRRFMKLAKQVPDNSSGKELQSQIRSKFKINRNVEDVSIAKRNLSLGEQEYKQLEAMVLMTK